jgi:hypothetical protein
MGYLEFDLFFIVFDRIYIKIYVFTIFLGDPHKILNFRHKILNFRHKILNFRHKIIDFRHKIVFYRQK